MDPVRGFPSYSFKIPSIYAKVYKAIVSVYFPHHNPTFISPFSMRDTYSSYEILPVDNSNNTCSEIEIMKLRSFIFLLRHNIYSILYFGTTSS